MLGVGGRRVYVMQRIDRVSGCLFKGSMGFRVKGSVPGKERDARERKKGREGGREGGSQR
jgi:hypothetical protein